MGLELRPYQRAAVEMIDTGGKTSSYMRGLIGGFLDEIPAGFSSSSYMHMLIHEDAAIGMLYSTVHAAALRNPNALLRVERNYPHDDAPVYSVVSGQGDKRRVFVQGQTEEGEEMTVKVLREIDQWVSRAHLKILAS